MAIKANNAVSNAVGTATQFAKQPESVYGRKLQAPSFGAGIHQQTDYDARLLAQSLGVLGDNIMKEAIAMDKRKQEQFTMEDAQRMLAGKTSEDLAKFDRVNSLQHAKAGFDVSDNPYAVANLDRAIGQNAAKFAAEQWAQDAASQHPKTVNEAINSFNEYLQDAMEQGKSNTRNEYAYSQGFFESYQSKVLQVASTAHKRINDEMRAQGKALYNTKLTDIVSNADKLDTENFKTQMGEVMRGLQSFCTTSDEAKQYITKALEAMSDNAYDMEKFDAIKDVAFFDDRVLGSEIPFARYKKKIATNCVYRDALNILNQYKRADGTADMSRVYNNLFSPKAGKITPVNMRVSTTYQSGFDKLSDEIKAAVPYIGGILSSKGFGEVMELTSGYRDADHNASVNGSPTSYHLTGGAVDIYLGDLSERAQQDIKDTFSAYFDEVLYHDAGTGMHLHLAGYKGGIENAEGPEEPVDYERAVRQYQIASAQNNQVIAFNKQKYNEYKTDFMVKLLKIENPEEALRLIENDDKLNVTDVMKLKRSVEAQAKRAAKVAAQGGNTKLDAEYKKSKTQVINDIIYIRDYNNWLSHNIEVTDEQTLKYKRAWASIEAHDITYDENNYELLNGNPKYKNPLITPTNTGGSDDTETKEEEGFFSNLWEKIKPTLPKPTPKAVLDDFVKGGMQITPDPNLTKEEAANMIKTEAKARIDKGEDMDKVYKAIYKFCDAYNIDAVALMNEMGI